MRLSTPPNKFRVDEENPYWISFSDLMSALLVVFILAAVALIIELTETQKKIENNIEQLRNAEQARKDILYEVKDELAKQGIEVIVDETVTILTIPTKTLTFISNRHEMPRGKEKRNNIEAIGVALHRAINKSLNQSQDSKKRFKYLDTVFIEGHTDSVPTRHYLGGNWELSALRAISLWGFWTDNLMLNPKLEDMKNYDGKNLFSVSGYADTRRVQQIELTREQKEINRRIDIRFTVKRPKISELEEIVDQ